MNPLSVIPLPYKLAGLVVAAIAVGAYGFSLGLAWNADDLAACEQTIDEVRRISDELAIKNEEQRLLSERVTQDVSNSWAAALDHARAHPSFVRVRQPANRCPGQMPGISPTATSHEGLQAGSGAGGYLEITLDQCEALANDSILDAEWIDLAKRLTDELHGVGK